MSDGTTPHVCLSMIVRNEGATLERCLTAAAPLIDAAVICDTGSTDGTVDIARRWLEQHGRPFVIHSHAWRDFGSNRTQALDASRAFVADLGWQAEHTWWLLLDADLEIAIPPRSREVRCGTTRCSCVIRRVRWCSGICGWRVPAATGARSAPHTSTTRARAPSTRGV
jgi:glycosyltransferase involved in cell wall biosynthesis